MIIEQDNRGILANKKAKLQSMMREHAQNSVLQRALKDRILELAKEIDRQEKNN
jgi:hypothetical protein